MKVKDHMKEAVYSIIDDYMIELLKRFYTEEAGYLILNEKFTKNNNIEEYSLIINNNESSAGVVIYVDDLYEKITKFEISLDEAVDFVVSKYEESKHIHFKDFTANVQDFDTIKDKIYMKLVNAKDNDLYLHNMPYIPFCDLAIVFGIAVNIDKEGLNFITIKDSLFSFWNIDLQEIYEAAKINTPKLFPLKIEPITDVLSNCFLNEDKEAEEFITMKTMNQLFKDVYVLSNESYINGATVILYEEVQNFLKSQEDNRCILPSSIHEVIVAPMRLDIEDLINMVTEINETEVAATDVLSNSVYYYDKETNQIKVYS